MADEERRERSDRIHYWIGVLCVLLFVVAVIVCQVLR